MNDSLEPGGRRVIDSHVHLSTYTGKGVTLEQCLDILSDEMFEQGINYAIVIPDNREGDRRIADLATARRLVGSRPNIFLLGSPQIIERGSAEVDTYRRLLETGIIKGLKLFPGHEPFTPLDDRCLPYYRMLEEVNAPVLIHTGEHSSDPTIRNPLDFNDPSFIVEVANRFPDLTIGITHYYWPRLDYCYEITRHVPNIYFDIAACGDEEVLDASGGSEKMVEILWKTVEDRPNQVIFGSDWPLCDSKGIGSFKRHLDLVQALELPPDLEEKLLWKNASAIYRLPVETVQS